jgi:hypothetical protein
MGFWVFTMFPGMREKRLGPRGGETTVSKTGMIRKNVWLHPDEAEALRVKAFKERRTESEILREGLRKVLELED